MSREVDGEAPLGQQVLVLLHNCKLSGRKGYSLGRQERHGSKERSLLISAVFLRRRLGNQSPLQPFQPNSFRCCVLVHDTEQPTGIDDDELIVYLCDDGGLGYHFLTESHGRCGTTSPLSSRRGSRIYSETTDLAFECPQASSRPRRLRLHFHFHGVIACGGLGICDNTTAGGLGREECFFEANGGRVLARQIGHWLAAQECVRERRCATGLDHTRRVFLRWIVLSIGVVAATVCPVGRRREVRARWKSGRRLLDDCFAADDLGRGD